MANAKRGKILVIRGGAIGDFILTLPAIAALRQTFPDTHLELLGYPALARLAQAAGVIDASRSIEARPLARFFARNAPLDPEWSSYFESFAIIVSYLYDPDDIFKTNVGRASKAQFIQGQHRPHESEHHHATGVFLKPLERLAIYEADPTPRLQITSSLNTFEVAAHPGSGSEKKNWPEEKWAKLLSLIDREILLIGGEAEGDRLHRLRQRLPDRRIHLGHNLPLSELAANLRNCRVFIGHDSGITHLAAAVGIPVIALWGPSNDRIWRPLGTSVRLIHAEGGIENIEPSAVLNAVNALGAA